ncbi:MAG: serine/threonine protein kinase [Xenococcaceae cyanobacterium]
MMTDFNNNRLLANRYKLVELVGTGAMGQVYRAEDTLLGGVSVAVKFLSQTLLNRKMRERFEREATISALLGEKSIHIVRVRDYGVDQNEIPFYVMEFLQGESLSEIIRCQPLPLPRFLSLTRQMCLGMECAHKGIIYKRELCPIIHRDIKPSNIFIIEDPTLGELVKILDFGIAKLIQSSDAQTHSFMGTLAYCSPEQIQGKELDNRSDIYSLGVMMYELLTSEMPILPENLSFGGWYQAHQYSEPEPFNPNLDLPPAVERLVMHCLAKTPSNRPQSVGEILQTLDSLEQKPSRNRIEIEADENNVAQDATLINLPSVEPAQNNVAQEATLIDLPSIDEIGDRASWPKDKPQQKIVFPRLIHASEGVFATLWVMLDHQDILNRMSSTRYNQFLFLTSPHPMLLWITVLHNLEHGPRWLPCYLDLKTSVGQEVTRILGESGCYRILFFALNEPQRCKNVMTLTIAADQCKILNDWANASQTLRAGQPEISKTWLKQEFEKLKPKILLKLEAVYTDYPTNISG